MRLFLGVDVGASKSHALIADETGAVLGVGEGGPGNQEMVGYDGLAHVLHAILDQALRMAHVNRERISAMGFGIGGYDWPSDRLPHEKVISELGVNTPFELVNDALIGLIAGSQEGWGLSVVAGTGNNCRGRDRHGREGRVSGSGYWAGERGGGTDLALRGMEAVTKAWCMRGPPTMLTDMYMMHFNVSDMMALLEGLSRGRFRIEPSMAMLVFRAAHESDGVALSCVKWMGHELASLAEGVIHQLAFETLACDVVLTGSLYDGHALLVETMRHDIEQIAPHARLHRLTAPPVVGGVLLAMERVGLDLRIVRRHLIAEARDAYLRQGLHLPNQAE